MSLHSVVSPWCLASDTSTEMYTCTAMLSTASLWPGFDESACVDFLQVHFPETARPLSTVKTRLPGAAASVNRQHDSDASYKL